MTMVLDTYTRELTGFTPGILTNADPMFHPISCPYANFTFNSGTEFTIASGGSVRRVELCGIPAYWRDDIHYPNNVLGVEWLQNRDEGDGGFAFYNPFQGGFGVDSNMYLFMLGHGAGTEARLYYGPEGTFTQVDAKAFATGGWVKFRASLTHTGTANRVSIEYWNSLFSAWHPVLNSVSYDFTDGAAGDMGDHFSLALRTRNTYSLNIKDVKPNGLIPDAVFDFTGQSELNGRAAVGQRNTDTNLVCVQRDRGTVTLDDGASPLVSGGWGGNGTAATGSNWQNSSDGGGSSWPVNFIKWYAEYYSKPNIICNAMAVLGAQPISALLGPASLDDRMDTSKTYNVGGLGACRERLTAMLAGDGQNGCPITHVVHQGTRDVVLGTSQAAYKASLDSLLARWALLQPTSTARLKAIGDRMWLSTVTSPADNQAIRDAHLAVLAAGDAKPLGDEAWITGAVGSNVGWPDHPPADTDHPGDATNLLLSLHAQYGFRGVILTDTRQRARQRRI